MEGSSIKFVPVSFKHSISVKLDNGNFLLWHQQVVAAIKGHKLQKFILDGLSSIPPKFLSTADEVKGQVNGDFLDWEQQDQLLVSWLLSSMTEGVLTSMVGYDTASQIWNTLDLYFASQTLGYFLSTSDHINAIFDGLSSEYDTFVVSVSSRNDAYTVTEIESLLLAQESRIEKNLKTLDSALPNVVNVATRSSNQNRRPYSNFTPGSSNNFRPSFNSDSNFQSGCGGPAFSNSGPSQFGGSSISGSPQMTALLAAYMATPESVCDSSWYPDSDSNYQVPDQSFYNYGHNSC
ncbi:hypothetical protein QYF36_022262 [Acer negundo]|nr:hypothetical protein QYF36_022262 [Acer negundo]